MPFVAECRFASQGPGSTGGQYPERVAQLFSSAPAPLLYFRGVKSRFLSPRCLRVLRFPSETFF